MATNRSSQSENITLLTDSPAERWSLVFPQVRRHGAASSAAARPKLKGMGQKVESRKKVDSRLLLRKRRLGGCRCQSPQGVGNVSPLGESPTITARAATRADVTPIPKDGSGQPRSAEKPLTAKLLNLHEKALRVETESRKMGGSDDEDPRAGAASAKVSKSEAVSLVDFILAKQTLKKEMTSATNVVIGSKGILATLKAASRSSRSLGSNHDQARRIRQYLHVRVVNVEDRVGRRELAGLRELRQRAPRCGQLCAAPGQARREGAEGRRSLSHDEDRQPLGGRK